MGDLNSLVIRESKSILRDSWTPLGGLDEHFNIEGVLKGEGVSSSDILKWGADFAISHLTNTLPLDVSFEDGKLVYTLESIEGEAVLEILLHIMPSFLGDGVITTSFTLSINLVL